MMKPPIEFLTDSFTYKEYLGTNDWSEPEYAEEVEIKNCRIDKGAEYTHSNAGKTLLYNSLIFCYVELTNPIKEFKVESKIYFDDVEHTITRVLPIKEPLSEKLYAYEIEVI